MLRLSMNPTGMPHDIIDPVSLSCCSTRATGSIPGTGGHQS
jgi:hypothetical protein